MQVTIIINNHNDWFVRLEKNVNFFYIHCIGDLAQAKLWHQRQLDVALATKDKVAEGRACSNLGIVYQLLGEHDAALKLHQAHLGIARSLGDKAGMGRAYGNIGNAYNALGYYEQAIKYHKQELTISKEVRDYFRNTCKCVIRPS